MRSGGGCGHASSHHWFSVCLLFLEWTNKHLRRNLAASFQILLSVLDLTMFRSGCWVWLHHPNPNIAITRRQHRHATHREHWHWLAAPLFWAICCDLRSCTYIFSLLLLSFWSRHQRPTHNAIFFAADDITTPDCCWLLALYLFVFHGWHVDCRDGSVWNNSNRGLNYAMVMHFAS
jgi:hypothetical protein